jgi:poly-gamma-glutamate capsule biosynthesis protein CapA/YwtB (metallophosphatase superfamily)
MLFSKNFKGNNIIPPTSEKNNETVEEPKPDINFSMSVIGDIMCHNSQYIDAYVSSKDTYDFSYVFEDIKPYVSSADIAVGNLETTFAGKSKGYSNYPRFNTPEQLATNLKDFGIDVVSTANNHCMDTGYAGITSTLKYLDEAGISHMGTYSSEEAQNTILIKEVKGVKIAFLAFTYGTNGIAIPKDKLYSVNLIDKDFISKQLSLAKEQSPDLICVSMHWGIEYQTKQNSEQEDLANFLLNNGVDVILGSHPHVLQPMEKKTVTLEDGTTKNCFVIYSLGNFMSGQSKANTRNSVILNMKFTQNGKTGKTSIDSVSYVPIYMYKDSSKKTHKYRILDIEKTISNYDSGSDKSIGDSNYSTLKTELTKIKKTMGDNLVF